MSRAGILGADESVFPKVFTIEIKAQESGKALPQAVS
jgi:hypothetical protein